MPCVLCPEISGRKKKKEIEQKLKKLVFFTHKCPYFPHNIFIVSLISYFFLSLKAADTA